ncbi:HDOD domain-containing protein [Lysobacter humi (ex Lee et al. 2017)]
MLNRLLRRLQGRPTPAHDDARRGDAVVATSAEVDDASWATDGTVIAADELRARGLRWLLDAPHGVSADGAASAQALAYLEAVAQRLDPRRLPRLPALVPQLLAALRREDVDAQSLATLLARDPTLAGDVMRIANSAFHRRATPATGLAQAITVLGADGLRHVVFTSVMRPILRPDARSAIAARLWQLSETRTWLCARIAPGHHDVAEAQLTAVVASTGAGALLSMVPAALLVPAASDPAFVRGFDGIARAVTAHAAVHWQLPDAVLQALREGDGAREGLAAVLRTGDLLAIGAALARDGQILPDETPYGIDGTLDTAAAQRRLVAAFAAEHEADEVESAA